VELGGHLNCTSILSVIGGKKVKGGGAVTGNQGYWGIRCTPRGGQGGPIRLPWGKGKGAFIRSCRWVLPMDTRQGGFSQRNGVETNEKALVVRHPSWDWGVAEDQKGTLKSGQRSIGSLANNGGKRRDANRCGYRY